MNDRHPTRETLESFSNGSLDFHESKRVVTHLLGGCSQCQEILTLMTEPLFEPLSQDFELPPELDAAYDAAIAAAYATALEKTGKGSASKSTYVMPRGAEGLPRPDDPAFFTREVCEVLLEKSYAVRVSDPETMLQLAELAARSAEDLDPEVYGADQVADLQARAWAEVANAYRVIGDNVKADQMMAVAVDCRARGTGDPRLLARLSDLAAALACAQRRFDEAFRLLDIAYTIYLKLGDKHSAGRVLIARGLYAGYTGETLEGIRYLVHGLNTIDRARDPRLALQALHNILLLRVDLGEYREARKTIRQMRPLYDRYLGEVEWTKVRWVEGRIAAGLGELDEAETAFHQVREKFERAGLAYRAALASLDLIGVWLRQGRTPEIRQHVAELIAAFRATGVEREALAGMLLLRDAVECDQATQELLQLIALSIGRLDGRSAPPLDPEVR